MKELLWRLVAFIVTRPMIRRWIIKRATRTPYTHIMSADGLETYMFRYWLFNPYHGAYEKRWQWMGLSGGRPAYAACRISGQPKKYLTCASSQLTIQLSLPP